MKHTTLLAAAMAALSIAAAPVSAADLLPAPPVPRVIPAPIEVGGGWYLRGDVGVGVQNYDSLRLTAQNPPTPTFLSGFVMESDRFSNPTLIGLGAGYQFNEWFRVDATLDYRSASEFGFTLVNRQVSPLFPNGNVYVGTLQSTVAMLNGYVDLGNFWGLTPFVGAGVGYAWHRIEGFTDQGVGASLGGYGIAAPRNSGEFAWALHAGVAYAATENLKLELSYRYINLGNVEAGRINCFGGCPQVDYSLNRMDSHDFRVGMRWAFNAAPVAVPPPMIRPVIARN